MCARAETRHRLQQHRHTTRRQGRCNTLAQHPLAEAMAQPWAGTLTSDTSQTKRSSEKSRSNRRFHQTAKCIRQKSPSDGEARQREQSSDRTVVRQQRPTEREACSDEHDLQRQNTAQQGCGKPPAEQPSQATAANTRQQNAPAAPATIRAGANASTPHPATAPCR